MHILRNENVSPAAKSAVTNEKPRRCLRGFCFVRPRRVRTYSSTRHARCSLGNRPCSPDHWAGGRVTLAECAFPARHQADFFSARPGGTRCDVDATSRRDFLSGWFVGGSIPPPANVSCAPHCASADLPFGSSGHANAVDPCSTRSACCGDLCDHSVLLMNGSDRHCLC